MDGGKRGEQQRFDARVLAPRDEYARLKRSQDGEAPVARPLVHDEERIQPEPGVVVNQERDPVFGVTDGNDDLDVPHRRVAGGRSPRSFDEPRLGLDSDAPSLTAYYMKSGTTRLRSVSRNPERQRIVEDAWGRTICSAFLTPGRAAVRVTDLESRS